MLKNQNSKNLLERLYSQILTFETNSDSTYLDLSLSQPILNQHHPKSVEFLLKCIISPNELNNVTHAKNSSKFIFFDSIKSAKAQYPQFKIIKAIPAYVGLELNHDCIYDLGFWGTIVQTKSLQQDNTDISFLSYFLEPFASYMTSSDLWGQNGKWQRINEDLYTFLLKKNLFSTNETSNIPCFFNLKPEVSIIEKYGFKGETTEQSFDLYLPWMFSLNNLEMLKQAIGQEF